MAPEKYRVGETVEVRRSTGEWTTAQVADLKDGYVVTTYLDESGIRREKRIKEDQVEKFLKRPGKPSSSKSPKPPAKQNGAQKRSRASTTKEPASKKAKAPPKKTTKTKEEKEGKRATVVPIIRDILTKAVEEDILRLGDDIVFKKSGAEYICTLTTSGDEDKVVVVDEQTGKEFDSVVTWSKELYGDKAKNARLTHYCRRDGTDIRWGDICLQLAIKQGKLEDTGGDFIDLKKGIVKKEKKKKKMKVKDDDGSDSDSSSSSSSSSSGSSEYLHDEEGNRFICGICKKTDFPGMNPRVDCITCDAQKSLRSKDCLRMVHSKCILLASGSQIPKNHNFYCEKCFVPYMRRRENKNLVKYMQEDKKHLQALFRERGTLRLILPEILAKGPKDTYLLDNNFTPTDEPAQISAYSYCKHDKEHQAWFTSLLKEAWGGSSGAKPSGRTSKGAEAASPVGGDAEVIELDDDETVEEDINKIARDKANAVLTNKDFSQVVRWDPMVVHTLRFWQGPSSSNYVMKGGQVVFQPPDANEVAFMEGLSGERAPLNWYVYFQLSEGNLQLVFWPGHDEFAKAVPIHEIEEYRSGVDNEEVHLHFGIRSQDLLDIRNRTRQLMRRPMKKTSPNRSQTIRAVEVDDGHELVHLVCLAHAPWASSQTQRSDKRATLKAAHYLLEVMLKARVEKQLWSSGALGQEICWARTTSADLLGLSQCLFTYGVQTSMDKGHLLLDDFDRLRERRFLNGDCINFFLQHLKANLPEPVRKSVYIFPTHFMTACKKLFSSISNSPSVCPSDPRKAALQWACGSKGRASDGGIAQWEAFPGEEQQESLFKYKYLIVPVNDPGRHWMLGLVVNLPSLQLHTDAAPVDASESPALLYLDSLNLKDSQGFLTYMPRFLAYRAAGETILKRRGKMKPNENVPLCKDFSWVDSQEKYAADEWSKFWKLFNDNRVVPRYNPRVPKQLNHTDCGVHVIHMAERFITKPPQSLTPGCVNESWFDPRTTISTQRKRIKDVIRQRTSEDSPELIKHLDRIDEAHRKWEQTFFATNK